MAGRPKFKNDMQLLEQLPGEMILSMLEAGKSQTNICFELGIGRRALEQWIDDNDPDIIARARAIAADRLAVETLEIADGMDAANPARDAKRISTRQWLAERWDSKTYGGQKAASININIASMRLDALRHIEVNDVVDAELSTDADKQ